MNNVVLIGRLTKDPEMGYTPNTQTAVCKFTLAVDRQGNGTDFLRITVFGKQAENCGKYLSRGRQCAVHGRIETGSYKNRNGETVYTTDIIANNVEFIGGQQNQPPQGQANYQPQQSHQQSFADTFEPTGYTPF